MPDFVVVIFDDASNGGLVGVASAWSEAERLIEDFFESEPKLLREVDQFKIYEVYDPYDKKTYEISAGEYVIDRV